MNTDSSDAAGSGPAPAPGAAAAPYPAPKSIIIVGAGVFGPYSLLRNPRYDQTHITLLDQWASSQPADSSGVTPASVDNSRIIRPDYPYPAYARLAVRAQKAWRGGWPLTLPVPPSSDDAQRTPQKQQEQPYREAGLLITCWDDGDKTGHEQNTQNDDAHDTAKGPVPSEPAPNDHQQQDLNPDGRAYVTGTLQNVTEMAALAENLGGDPSMAGKITELASRAAISARLGTGPAGVSGDWGYLNGSSGWADAGAAMAVVRARTHALVAARNAPGSKTAGAAFVEGEGARVAALVFADAGEGDAEGSKLPIVTGVRLERLAADGEQEVLSADLVVVAAGAWSPKLLPRSLGARVRATGQVMGYIGLEPDEATKLSSMPVPINMSTGLFAFPPIATAMPDGSVAHVTKVARHGWGYAHRVRVPDVEPASVATYVSSPTSTSTSPPTTTSDPATNSSALGALHPDRTITVQLPAPHSGGVIGPEGSAVLQRYIGELGLSPRPWRATRTCWYADTATCDFLIDYVPAYGARSLFVATGGSGHGFKFAPVVGDCVVAAIEGSLESGSDATGGDAELGRQLRRTWRWRDDQEDAENWRKPGDGSRGGPRGMEWWREMGKGAIGAEMA